MPYEKQEFKNRIVDENGTIIQEGTELRAEHLDHIEDGIITNEKAIEEVNKKIPTDYAPSNHNHDGTYQPVGNYALKNEIPTSPSQVGAEPSGTAEAKVNTHNTSEEAHNDIRLLVSNLRETVAKFLDVDDVTVDQLSEVLKLINDNKGDLESLTTSKVNVTDIINNLTTSVTNKPLSAKQGVVLKALIDGISIPTKTSQLANDSNFVSKEVTDELYREIVNQKVYVTPQMYGAKGDGTTDDTQAFENALAENSHVFLPKGQYLITRPLDISYKKSLVGDESQSATILYGGTNSVVYIGRQSVFRNVNIIVQNEFDGIVFDTNNYNKQSSSATLESRVEHVNVKFKVYSPNATLIGIVVDSGTDVNNTPTLTGICYQSYNDIIVESGSSSYGCGVKMELIQGREFVEEAKQGFPWLTHINYNDICLGSPYTAIKSMVTNTSGYPHFERINAGHIMFNNVYTQHRNAQETRYFLDLENISAYFTKCIGWDYHHISANGEKINIIGENVTASISDSEMKFGVELLESCEFTAETETNFNVAENPEYFMKKYFNGTYIRNGYDMVDAKIDTKLTSEFVANVAEKKVNEILYSGYYNVLEDPRTQIRVGCRYSTSNSGWIESDRNTTLIIPIVRGGNIIRWEPSTYKIASWYANMYFFNDDLQVCVESAGYGTDLWDSTNGYLVVNNPLGYKYLSISLNYYEDISAETMIMTINREIDDVTRQSYTEYIKEDIIDPAIEDGFKKLAIPKKTSELENDSGFLTEHQDISGKVDNTETLTLVGIDENDVAHTWTIYGEVVS